MRKPGWNWKYSNGGDKWQLGQFNKEDDLLVRWEGIKNRNLQVAETARTSWEGGMSGDCTLMSWCDCSEKRYKKEININIKIYFFG